VRWFARVVAATGRHRTLREGLGVFVLDKLDTDERVAVQAHLGRCRACRSEVERLVPVVELLGRADPRLVETDLCFRWPGLVIPHAAPAKAWLAERLFRQTVGRLRVRAVFPGGEVAGAGGPGSPVMRILRPVTFFHRRGIDAARPTDERNTVAGARTNIHATATCPIGCSSPFWTTR
jgi:anti-sigma factor RsiW